MAEQNRRTNTLWLWAGAFVLLIAIHAPYLTLPYYWDELGQFIPQALDLYSLGRWIPVHTTPNIHPPGVIALLALVWKLTLLGHSIPVTRIAMLAIAALAVTGSFRLAIRLSQKADGFPAFAALLMLLSAPLFFTQSMMAQLDMPAMAFTIWALVYFLERKFAASALWATIAVLMKETAIVLPVIAALWLIRDNKRKEAAFFAVPAAVLAAWVAILWHSTGHLFGAAEFARYNALYSLHPVRLNAALLRRIFYLFFAEFRWIGTIGIILAWRKTNWLRSPDWALAGTFALAHILAVSAFGGAVLERYLLPVLPILFAAMGIGWMSFEGRLRILIPAAAVVGGLFSMVWYPPYPFPYENNLAMMDFVETHKLIAQYLETEGFQTVATAWPLSDALRRPEFGYVRRPFTVVEMHDFRLAHIAAVNPAAVDALVIYSREWRPALRLFSPFLTRFYDYEPQASSAQIVTQLGLRANYRWEHRGMWVEIYRNR